MSLFDWTIAVWGFVAGIWTAIGAIALGRTLDKKKKGGQAMSEDNTGPGLTGVTRPAHGANQADAPPSLGRQDGPVTSGEPRSMRRRN